MTEPLITREYGGELHTRADASGSDERIIEGVVIPYGAVANVKDSPTGPRYRETIARGAVAGMDTSKVMLQSLPRETAGHNTHDGAVLVGRAIAADDGDERLHMSFQVAKTRDGDELLELARAGILTRLSAG